MKKQHAKLAEEFYDKIVKLHHEEFSYKEIHYKKWLDLLVSKLRKGDIILDLGCGNGRAIKYLVDNGFQGVGIDISAKMIKLAKAHVPGGKFYKQQFTEINFQPRSISAIISFFALNHVSRAELKEILRQCRKVLKKDGFLLLGMVKGKGEGLFGGFYNKNMQLFGAAYTEKELREVLVSSGYITLKMGVEHFKGKHFEEDDIYVLSKVKKSSRK